MRAAARSQNTANFVLLKARRALTVKKACTWPLAASVSHAQVYLSIVLTAHLKNVCFVRIIITLIVDTAKVVLKL